MPLDPHKHNGIDSPRVWWRDLDGFSGLSAAQGDLIYLDANTNPQFIVPGVAGNVLTSNGTGANPSWNLLQGVNSFGGTGADGALSVGSGTTTISLANAAVVTKNYTTFAVSGTGALAFSNPNTNGTIVIIKSTGNFTVTSSTNPAIDLRSLGGAGGSGGTGGTDNGPVAGGGGGASATTDGSTGGAGDASVDGRNNTNGNAFGIWIAGDGSGGGITGGQGGNVGTNDGHGGVRGLHVFHSGYAPYARAYVVPGSGGGGGQGANGANGGAGGIGGGALYVECGGAYNVTSTINLAGTTGVNGAVSGPATGGGGGGGGGGSIQVFYSTLTADTGTYTVTGGAASTGGGAGGAGGNGYSSILKF